MTSGPADSPIALAEAGSARRSESAGGDGNPARVPVSNRRLESLDAYRGFAMLLMASDGLGIGRVARSFPESGTWQFLADQVEHRQWRGCTVWDLIQPSFTFMVGVAMPYSLA